MAGSRTSGSHPTSCGSRTCLCTIGESTGNGYEFCILYLNTIKKYFPFFCSKTKVRQINHKQESINQIKKFAFVHKLNLVCNVNNLRKKHLNNDIEIIENFCLSFLCVLMRHQFYSIVSFLATKELKL